MHTVYFACIQICLADPVVLLYTKLIYVGKSFNAFMLSVVVAHQALFLVSACVVHAKQSDHQGWGWYSPDVPCQEGDELECDLQQLERQQDRLLA